MTMQQLHALSPYRVEARATLTVPWRQLLVPPTDGGSLHDEAIAFADAWVAEHGGHARVIVQHVIHTTRRKRLK